MRRQGDRVVIGDGGQVLEAEDRIGIEVVRPGAIGGFGLRRRLGEARIVALEEAGKESVGGLRVGDARETEFSDQAILEGTALPLDAPFGLWGRSGNPLNAQLLQSAADLSRRGATAQLLLDRERALAYRRPLEDPVAIGVDGEGEAIGLSDLVEEQEVALGILLRTEDSAQDGARGIVHGVMERELGTAVLKPGVVAAVHLHEHAGLGVAVATAAMLSTSPGARAADTLRGEETVECWTGEEETFPFGEELAEMLEVHAHVGGADELKDPCPRGISHPSGRDPAAVPMDQGGRAASAIGAPEPLSLPDGSSQEGGGLSHLEFGPLEGIEDHEMLHLLLRQGHHASRFRLGRGVTFSLNA